jgi:hypothetical protein
MWGQPPSAVRRAQPGCRSRSRHSPGILPPTDENPCHLPPEVPRLGLGCSRSHHGSLHVASRREGKLTMKAADSAHGSGRNTAAVLILIVCCLLSSARLVVKSPGLGRLMPDDIAARSDQRFAALKAAIPGRGIFGYVGPPGDSGLPEYYLAQYALAPRVVERSTNHALVVGNFPASSQMIAPQGLQLVKDFGNGVLLFSNKDAR